MASPERLEAFGAARAEGAGPAPGCLLRTKEAFDATHPGQPSFTFGGKNERDFTRGKVQTELGETGDIGVARPKAPTWTMKPRWKDDGPRGAGVPAPGDYANPTTLAESHPTLPCSGKGWSWGGSERQTMALGTPSPGPGAYMEDCKDTAMTREPSWPMLGRWKDAEKKEQVPALQNTGGMRCKGGVARSPEWPMTSRPKSAMVLAGAAKIPGPGAHSPMYGDIGAVTAPIHGKRRSPSWGFGSSTRWTKPPESAAVL